MKKYSLLFALLLVAACSSTHKVDSSQQTPTSPAVASAVAAQQTAQASPAETAEHQLASELQALQKESVYFDFDKSVVKPEFQDAISKQASFIKAHKNDVVTLEGNCDERGSSKYNLALGERRALATKKALQSMGVPAAQIKTVSYGKEKPRLLCHEEHCWKENRRVDFVHTTK